MATPGKPAKAMSSRLSSMKFMQRGAASPSSTPERPSERPLKKQRLSNEASNAISSSTTHPEPQAEGEALTAEGSKRAEALNREAADRGESKWYLSFKEPKSATEQPPLRIVSAGYSTLDAGSSAKERLEEEKDEEEDKIVRRPQIAGRRSFGRFNKAVEKQQNPDLSSSDSDDESEDAASDEDEDASDDPTGAGALIAQSRREAGEKARAERKAKRKAEKAETARLAEERRKKQVKLNGLTSISANSGGSPSAKDITCHTCGQKGHMRRDCPQASQQRSRRI